MIDFDMTVDMGIRSTIRPEEFVRLIPIRSDTGLPQSYVLDVAQVGLHPGEPVPILTNPITGDPESPAMSYSLPAALDTDPFAEEERVYTQGRSTAHVWASRRGHAVTRWRSVMSEFGYDIEWSARNGPEGLGSGFSHASRWTEQKFRYDANMHNPTHGGTYNLPAAFGASRDVSSQLTAQTAPTLHFLATTTRIQGGCIPCQWDADGTIEPGFSPFLFQNTVPGLPHGNPHAGEVERVILWWRQKSFEDYQPHYGGHEFIHRITYWDYYPLALNVTDFGDDAPTRLEIDISGAPFTLMQGLGFDTLHYADLGADSPVLTELVEFRTGVTTVARWQFTSAVTIYTLDVAKPDGPSFFPSGYALIVISRSSDEFAVGMIVKLELGTFGEQRLTRNAKTNIITIVRAIDPEPYTGTPQPPATEQPQELGTGVTATSNIGRDAGWVGFHQHLFTGPRSEALNAALFALGEGWLDEDPDTDMIPNVMRQGTELPQLGGNPGGLSGATIVGTSQFGGTQPSQSGGGTGISTGIVGADQLANPLRLGGRLR